MRALAVLVLLASLAPAGEDPYAAYLGRAPEFRPTAVVPGAFGTFYYIPWTWQWTIGHDDAAAHFCREHGINGGFLDFGDGPVGWLERNRFPFYCDHTEGKGLLYLRGANNKGNFRRFQEDPRALRSPPLDASTLAAARQRVERTVVKVRRSGLCLAYALDDEPSWGAFVLPLPWRVNEDDAAYARWLEGLHGRPVEPRWVTPEFTRAQLDRPLKDLDFSPFLDRMSWNDSVFAEFLGALVEQANFNDAGVPCGFVGAQNPSLWGGYDYAKLCAKVQFLEPYDSGSAPEIVRSLGRGRVTVASTHFHSGEPGRDSWEAWSRFAHGQRAMIGWVDESWFDGKTPRPWLKEFAPALKEIGGVQGPKLKDARWLHGGVAIYYSHASVQVSWVLDSEAHGKTWPNRGQDDLRGTSHLVRKAWENLLNDAGLQYDFVAYDRVVREGVPAEYDVLVLPACFALSDAEASRIREFAGRGGRIVADFMCGLFDQHGRGRARGALDDLFGVAHDGTERAKDFFGDRLWVETDQDEGYDAERWSGLPAVEGIAVRDGFVVAERRVEGPVIRDNVSYLNLSPQCYLALRAEGHAAPRHRETFLGGLGLVPAVRVSGDDHLETIRWEKDGRELLLIVQNPPLQADGSRALRRGRVPLTLEFPGPVTDVVDERSGEKLGEGARFRVPFERTEATFLSYARTVPGK